MEERVSLRCWHCKISSLMALKVYKTVITFRFTQPPKVAGNIIKFKMSDSCSMTLIFSHGHCYVVLPAV